MGRSPPPAPAVVPGWPAAERLRTRAGGNQLEHLGLGEPPTQPGSWALHRGARRGLARARPGTFTDPLAATRLALRCLARRVRDLEGEIALLEAELDPLTEKAAGGSVRRLRAALGGADARSPVNRRHRADHARSGGGGRHHDLLARARRDASVPGDLRRTAGGNSGGRIHRGRRLGSRLLALQAGDSPSPLGPGGHPSDLLAPSPTSVE